MASEDRKVSGNSLDMKEEEMPPFAEETEAGGDSCNQGNRERETEGENRGRQRRFPPEEPGGERGTPENFQTFNLYIGSPKVRNFRGPHLLTD